MDLPTYTNIWRIEKRLYKLYDLRLPMPLPLVQIGVFVGVFLPWIILLQVVGVPFHAPWHVVYLVPPGLLTWLATRPVIEGKRLTELLISQVRYLTEARTWARLTPIREPGEVVIVGRVWRHGRLAGDRLHVARAAEQSVEHPSAPEPAATPVAAAPPVLEYTGNGAEQAPTGAPRRPATAQRPQAPSLQPTPHDGSTVVPPAAPGERRLTPPAVEPTRPQPVRSEPASPPAAARPARPQPTAPQAVPGFPASVDPSTTPGAPASPGVPRPGRPERPELPATPAASAAPTTSPTPATPAVPAAGPTPADGEAVDRRAGERGRPGEQRPDTTPARGQDRDLDAPRRPTRPRNISHEPETPAANPRPVPPTLGRPAEPPAARPTGPTAPPRPETPARSDAPAKPAAAGPAGPVGRHAAPARPVAHPDASPASAPAEGSTPRPGGPTPARSGAAQPPAARPAAAPPSATGRPGEPADSGPPVRPAVSRQADEGSRPASVIPLPHGRHAKPAEDSPAARSAEPPTGNDDPARPVGRPPADGTAEHKAPAASGTEAPAAGVAERGAPAASGAADREASAAGGVQRETPASDAAKRVAPAAPAAAEHGASAPGAAEGEKATPGAASERRTAADGAGTAEHGPAAPADEEQDIAAARTDQIVWPTPSRRPSASRPDAGAAPSRDTSSGGRPARPATPARGRSHGDEATPSREARPAAARDTGSPAPNWTPPAPGRPATPPAPPLPAAPGVPPRAPAAGHPSSRTSPPQASPHAPAQPPAQSPAQPPRTQPARPAQVPAARPARPSAPSRQGAGQQPWQGRPEAAAGAPPESPARAVRSGPASPVRPGPMPQAAHEDEGRHDDGRGRRRIFSGGGNGDGDYEERVRTAFAGARRVVVLGCTGGAGQTVTGLMLGHTFAQHRGDRIVAVDVNPGPGAMARRTRTETRETLTSLIAHAEQVTGYQMMRRYTSISKSGLEVVAAGKNPVQALDDRDYALAMRTLDRFYSITLLDAAAAVVARVLPYADQIVLVAPASSDAPRAVAMTFEWLDGHGYEDLRSRAVTVINGVSRRSMDDVEQAESVARGRCRALVRIPWDDHLSLDRAPRNELRSLRAPTRKAYIALGGVVAGGLVQTPGRYPQQEVSR
ncbi:TcpE family conjugal transfer membrane protein [Actinoallomurus sp. NPDC052274]|uniref:TcpE family conjugal transfer membrane protein n=1 Tax=Actinoallomurus sp. NPDC052274 TaxID=3155420 RepID=UPI003437308E